MQSSTYKDIIDGKITEWQSDLKKLEKQAQSASIDTRSDLIAKIEQFRSKIATATVKLHNLDKHETAGNTMETKDKILEIFRFIDTDFPKYVGKTPFML